MSQGNSTTYNHTLTQAQLDELQFQHKYNVLQYNSNQVTTTSAQAYANTINGSNGGRTFATQSHSYTNPNTLNLQRWGYTATNNGGQLVCGNNTNNYEDIQTNADNIATNTTNIATNTTNIATNTTDIATNTTNISTNTTDIATNTTDIATNTTNIATNTTNIATNITNIATNTEDIATNTEDIAQNTEDIAQNTINIATSTTNIATNTTNIAIITNNASLLAPKESPQLTGNVDINGNLNVTGTINGPISTSSFMRSGRGNLATPEGSFEHANYTTVTFSSPFVNVNSEQLSVVATPYQDGTKNRSALISFYIYNVTVHGFTISGTTKDNRAGETGEGGYNGEFNYIATYNP